MRLSIKAKILTGYGISILLSLTLAVIGFLYLKNIQQTLVRVITKEAVYLRLVDECEDSALQIRLFEKDFFLNIGNSSEQEKYRAELFNSVDNCKKILDCLQKIQSTISLPSSTKTQISNLIKIIDQCDSDMKYVMDYLKGNDVITPQNANTMMSSYSANISLLESTIDSLQNSGAQLMLQTKIKEIRNAKNTSTTMLFVIILSIAGIIGLSIVFASKISRRCLLSLKLTDNISSLLDKCRFVAMCFINI